MIGIIITLSVSIILAIIWVNGIDNNIDTDGDGFH